MEQIGDQLRPVEDLLADHGEVVEVARDEQRGVARRNGPQQGILCLRQGLDDLSAYGWSPSRLDLLPVTSVLLLPAPPLGLSSGDALRPMRSGLRGDSASGALYRQA